MTISWRDDAACLTASPEIFFPDPSDVDTAVKAKQVCDRCTVADQCLEYAIRTRQQFGIWGGVAESARRRMRGQKGCEECNADVGSGVRFCRPCADARSKRAKQENNRSRKRSAQ